MEAEAPVELTAEEKASWCRKSEMCDISAPELSASFSAFSLPDKSEGFDKIEFAWQPGDKCGGILKDFVLGKKLTERVETLQPGKWFQDEWKKWNALVQQWKKLDTDWKNPGRKKAILAAKVKALSEKEGKEGEEKKEVQLPTIDMEELDVFAVEDVTDVGNGEPLFGNFVPEDWALLSLRYELHLLMHAFRKDLDDPERPGFTEAHAAFYFNKYFKKPLAPQTFGMSDLKGLQDLIKDVFGVGAKNSLLESKLAEETPAENFVKLTEDHRRERQRRLDAGDETAKINFRAAPVAPSLQAQKPGQGKPMQPGKGVIVPGQPAKPGMYSASNAPKAGQAFTPPGQYGAGQKRPFPGGGAPAVAAKQPRYAPNYTGYKR